MTAEEIELARAAYAMLQVILWLQIVQTVSHVARLFGNVLNAMVKGL